MRTRPDAQQEALTRRLALLRAEVPADRWLAEDPADPDDLSNPGDPGDPDDAGDGFAGLEAEDGWWAPHTRVTDVDRAAYPPALAPEDSAPLAVAVPVPGRHAARRSGTRGSTAPRGALPDEPPAGLPARLPEALRGRVRLGPAQVTVVALVLCAALALTCWWLARGRATTLEAPSPAASASPLVALAGAASTAMPSAPDSTAPDSVPAPASGATASGGAMVTVDVEGKVRHPGIVVVPAGSRVTDALEAAGGVPRHRLIGGLNLAAVLVDGQQIVVGAATPPAAGTIAGGTGTAAGSTGTGAGSAPAGQPDALVNLNTATADQLDTLPGVGPVTAQSILEWREQNGGFTSVQELLEVDGIGPATLAKLTPHVTV